MIVKIVKTCQTQAKNTKRLSCLFKKSKTGLQKFIEVTTNSTSKCKTQSAKAGFAMPLNPAVSC